MKTMRVGIELNDSTFTNVNLSQLDKGNPGIGGSEFLFGLLGMYLKKYMKDWEIVIYHYNDNQLSSEMKEHIICDELDLIFAAETDKVDVLIHQISKPDTWYEKLSSSQVKTIAWAHLYLGYKELTAINNCENVKRVVFVSKEQYDRYIDDDIIDFSTCIFNMINTNCEYTSRKNDYDPNVTYLGSLVPTKGFHILARIWPQIVKEFPDAKLHVIGSGTVYDRNAKLGKYNLAQEDYEQQFMKYLSDEKGKIYKSVIFHGLMGSEKEEIFFNTAVGVVNPTAASETFCMSAIEMQICGIPIVTKGKWGLLDTVKHKKTGLLFQNQKTFKKNLLILLKNRNLNLKYGNQAKIFVKENFGADKLIHQWISLLIDMQQNKSVNYLGIQSNYFKDFKWLRICIRFLRKKLKLNFIPSLENLKFAIKSFKIIKSIFR